MPREVFTSTSKRRALSPRQIRVGFLLVGLTLAIVLIGATAMSYASARGLAETVTRGQGAMILNALGDLVHPRPGAEPGEVELAAQIEDLDPELGLVYVAVIYADRSQRGPRFGEPSRPLEPDEFRATVREGLVREGAIARVIVPVGPPRGGPPPPGHPDRPPPPERGDADRPPPPGPRAHLVVEFEPLLAAKLERGALRELAVGIVGAVIMMLASLVFWRLSAAAERAEQRHEQQRRLAALGEMSAVLAHELRNPLASLKGHAQLLQERLERDAAEPRTTSKAARVVAEAQRLEQLTHGLLAFVRIGELDRRPASPAAIVEGAVGDLERERVDLELDAAPGSWLFDGPRMQQVIANLVDNGLQAAPDERVQVRVRERAGACEFEVRDRGPGVPADQRERIFEPFHTTRTRGTGLGLAVSSRIVELHGGAIEVDDNPGGGAVFRVLIPRL